MNTSKPTLLLGQVVATPGALAALAEYGVSPLSLLARHAHHDWGEGTCLADAQANACALENGGRILSVYLLAPDVRLWIISESDRSATTLLLPSEY